MVKLKVLFSGKVIAVLFVLTTILFLSKPLMVQWILSEGTAVEIVNPQEPTNKSKVKNTTDTNPEEVEQVPVESNQ